METIQKFQLGYAPRNNFFYNLATKHNLDLDLLAQVGLLKENNRDKFSDRIMVPILDRTSQVVGFTARVLPYENNPDRPKYLNSSQSNWFNKSELWYGWNLNANNIRQLKKAIIVEGNMDVIKATQSGFDYALASQGTSFTANQLRILKQITSTVHLAFDNDNAGRTSSRKFFIEATIAGLTVLKMLIPEDYKDLDEALSAGYKDFKIVPFLDYWLSNSQKLLISTDSTIQKQAIIDILELFVVLDPVSCEQYLTKLFEITKISVRTLQLQLAKIDKPVLEESVEVSNLSLHKITQDQLVVVAFQKLLIFYDMQPVLVENVFILLRVLLTELSEFETFEGWQKENQGELDLIKENQKDQDSKQAILSMIKQFINSNVGQFLMEEKLKEAYQEVLKF